MKKWIFYFLFIFSMGPLLAKWDPIFLNKPVNIDAVKALDYIVLRYKVTEFLKNSWCSHEKATLLMDLVLLEKPNVCVEIGVFTGSSVIPVAAALNYNKQGIIYAIDAWSNTIATQGMKDNDPNKAWWMSLDMNAIFNTYLHNINYWGLQNVCKTIQLPSKLAVENLPAIDFLHIDGNYSQETSCEDVLLYLPKVKVGGYILFTHIDWIVEDKAQRMQAFSLLLNSCEIVTDIDDRSTFLLRKLND